MEIEYLSISFGWVEGWVESDGSGDSLGRTALTRRHQSPRPFSSERPLGIDRGGVRCFGDDLVARVIDSDLSSSFAIGGESAP